MVETIRNPRPEAVHLKEHAFLTELVKLRISVEKSGRDELVGYTHGERGEESEKDVIERKSP